MIPHNVDHHQQNAVDEREASTRSQQKATQETPRALRNRSEIKKPVRYEVDVAEYVVPNTYEEAVNGKDAVQWAQAIEEELIAHEINHTWLIVPRTPAMKTIDSKWVFKIKNDTDREAQRYKARLCARGFMQRRGIDFTETFAPVMRYDSPRVFLAMVARKNLEILQFDVQTAFLYGKLQENIFMEIPEGLDTEKESRGLAANSVVCKLERSLYGVKQASRCCNQKFKEFLDQFEFKCSEADQCIFVGQFDSATVYFALFVDDGLIAAKSKKTIDFIIEKLSDKFEIKVCDSSVFVGLQIKRDRNKKTLVIHQRAYIEKVLEKFEMNNAKIVSVPADPHTILYPVESNDEKSIVVPYREAVGTLVFLSSVSRPDIAFAELCQQISK